MSTNGGRETVPAGVVQRWSEMIAFRSVLEVSCWGLTDEFIVEYEGKKGQG